MYSIKADSTQLAYLRRSIERVGVEDGLHHHQRLSDIFTVELITIVGTLVRAVVEHLEELGPSQVEHELCVCGCEGGEVVQSGRDSLYTYMYMYIKDCTKSLINYGKSRYYIITPYMYLLLTMVVQIAVDDADLANASYPTRGYYYL